MAITGALFNTLTFGNVNSGDYGVYISGEGVFDAPARDVEMISVPGRNGDIALDLGRYENITVEYPAGVFGDDNVDFRERLSDFRNAVLSQKGYQRLSDTYHPDEFRMGVYASGLEVTPVNYNEAGEFKLSFNCKPQRFLVAGEEEIVVANGDTVTNPTLLESGPLLKVDGFGDINFNGYSIEFFPDVLGEVRGWNTYTSAKLRLANWEGSYSRDFDSSLCEVNDSMQLRSNPDYSLSLQVGCYFPDELNYWYTVNNINTAASPEAYASNVKGDFFAGGRHFYVDVYRPVFEFNYGVSKDITISISLSGDLWRNKFNTSPTERVLVETVGIDVDWTVSYDGQKTITYAASINITQDYQNKIANSIEAQVHTGYLYIDSTVSSLGHPTYIDCDLGEAYKYENGELVPLNAFIDLGSDLPRLAPGGNLFALGNRINVLKVIPRWWKL